MDHTLAKDKIKSVFSKINEYCDAVYYGGSNVDSIINTPHDYDYICFAKPLCRHFLLSELKTLGFKTFGSTKTKESNLDLDLTDFSQVRVYPYTQIDWFSYLDILMIKVIGEDVCPKTDVIHEHRKEFFEDLHKKMLKLSSGEIKNQKRWYHLLRGIYILINNSYEVSSKQREEINILHDLSEGWEQFRDKTITLIKEFKIQNNY